MEYPPAEQLARELEELTVEMSGSAAQRDGALMKRLAAQHAEKKALHEVVSRLERVQAEKAEAAELAEDPELGALAADDVDRLTKEEVQLTAELEELLLPRDPRDSRDVILEIRAGAGGDEAGLFARELFRAYTRYAELHGWKVALASESQNEQGGFKEVVAEVAGDGAFGVLKFESGVHRVQRVPETEKQGRVHTSTVTVAVLAQAEEVDIEIKTEDLRVDTYRASGAGGQHVNKTSSAIRITHLPTNTVVAVQDERSQHKNKAKAMRILRARLLEAQEEERRSKEASSRKAQVGTGDRSEKIRTYNFPQDRITDHRIGESWSNIEGVMDGQLDPLFDALRQAERELLLGHEKE